MNTINGILKNGRMKKYHSSFLLGDIVKIINCGQQYECDDFNEYFHCGKKYLYIKHKSIPGNSWFPLLSPKENIWLIVGMAIHPFDSSEIILCLQNKRQKYCVFGSQGIELISKGKMSRTPEAIYQL